MTEEFTEKFANVEEALKYVADSQAKSEWANAKNQVESRARLDRIEEQLSHVDQQLAQVANHLKHISQLTGIAFEELKFQNEKLQTVAEVLSKKRI